MVHSSSVSQLWGHCTGLPCSQRERGLSCAPQQLRMERSCGGCSKRGEETTYFTFSASLCTGLTLLAHPFRNSIILILLSNDDGVQDEYMERQLDLILDGMVGDICVSILVSNLVFFSGSTRPFLRLISVLALPLSVKVMVAGLSDLTGKVDKLKRATSVRPLVCLLPTGVLAVWLEDVHTCTCCAHSCVCTRAVQVLLIFFSTRGSISARRVR